MSNSSEQMAYVLINPYTIYKSRTGGVISRLFTRTGLDLVAARMFAPSRHLAEEYAANIVADSDPQNRKVQTMIGQYVLDQYAPDPKTGVRRRVMMLVFQGKEAVAKVRQAVGSIDPSKGASGETIRDTYGDFITGADGSFRYFEPAVLAAPTVRDAEARIKIWARHSDADGGYLDNVVSYPTGTEVQRTLVLLKPDNFRFPNARPGNIVDMFSRTGLYIIAIKVHRMSVAEAREFYGPVLAVLRDKLRSVAGQRVRPLLEKEFEIALPTEVEQRIGEILGPLSAEKQFDNIVKFMTGRSPSQCSSDDEASCGLEKIVALVYEGPDAVAKIRNVLGPTDPHKAPPGTIRREMGQSIMVNAAHASDSPENAQREMNIVKIRENNLKSLVEGFYNCKL